jgi:putative component of membrane protein insertase Oxa1/YidC/SpoIIIJ protein YidD
VRAWCLLLGICSAAWAEEPWGTDAALAKVTTPRPPTISFSPCLYLIRFHQQVLSEADGPRSHFLPSSSEYTRQAILYWGAAMGFVLGCDRLLRENNDPWVYRKTKIRCGYLNWNPVPRPENGLKQEALERAQKTSSGKSGGLRDRTGSHCPSPGVR